MTDLVLHAVLHDQKIIIIKLFAKMKSSGVEYFEINIKYYIYL